MDQHATDWRRGDRNNATANLAEQFAAADVTGDNRLGFFEIIDWVY